MDSDELIAVIVLSIILLPLLFVIIGKAKDTGVQTVRKVQRLHSKHQVLEALTKLGDLRDSGILTDSEFEGRKNAVLTSNDLLAVLKVTHEREKMEFLTELVPLVRKGVLTQKDTDLIKSNCAMTEYDFALGLQGMAKLAALPQDQKRKLNDEISALSRRIAEQAAKDENEKRSIAFSCPYCRRTNHWIVGKNPMDTFQPTALDPIKQARIWSCMHCHRSIHLKEANGAVTAFRRE